MSYQSIFGRGFGTALIIGILIAGIQPCKPCNDFRTLNASHKIRNDMKKWCGYRFIPPPSANPQKLVINISFEGFYSRVGLNIRGEQIFPRWFAVTYIPKKLCAETCSEQQNCRIIPDSNPYPLDISFYEWYPYWSQITFEFIPCDGGKDVGGASQAFASTAKTLQQTRIQERSISFLAGALGLVLIGWIVTAVVLCKRCRSSRSKGPIPSKRVLPANSDVQVSFTRRVESPTAFYVNDGFDIRTASPMPMVDYIEPEIIKPRVLPACRTIDDRIERLRQTEHMRPIVRTFIDQTDGYQVPIQPNHNYASHNYDQWG